MDNIDPTDPTNPTDPNARRKLFSGAEWLTLFGMVAVVMSASQPWQKVVPPGAITVTEAYVTRTTHLVAAFDVRLGPVNVGYAVVVAGVICAALLLFSTSQNQKRPYLILQTVLSAAVLGLACYYAGPLMGIYLAVTGSLMLLAGGIVRYR